MLRQQGDAGDVRRLALVRRHAERRVTLGVLDGAEALALGEFDVVGRDVVLEIDETLACARVTRQSGTRRVDSSGIRGSAGIEPAWPQEIAAARPAR